MKLTLRVHVVTMIVASSYITLGLFSRDTAGELWWLYAIVTFFLASADLYLEIQDTNERKERQTYR